MNAMPRFDHPWLLVGLPLLWLAAAFIWRVRRPAIVFSDLRLFRGLPRGRSHWMRRCRFAAACLGGTSILLAAAGPRLPLPTRLTAEGIALMFVVDVSGSMFQRDRDWHGEVITRLAAATQVLELLIEGGVGPGGEIFPGRANDLMGLVVAASYPETEIPLTLSHRAITDRLRGETPRTLEEGQTNLGDAIAEALARLETARTKQRVIVLLSDGEHNFPGPAGSPSWSPLIAAQRAADLGVRIHAIDTGGSAPLQPEVRARGQETLRLIAERTGGLWAVADNVSNSSRSVKGSMKSSDSDLTHHASAPIERFMAFSASPV